MLNLNKPTNIKCHVTALDLSMFNGMPKVPCTKLFYLLTPYYMWHGTHAWGWGGRY